MTDTNPSLPAGPRFTSLPGYDTAPDVYETPTSPSTATARTSTSPHATESDTEATSESAASEDEAAFGVSRRRLYVSDARRRFESGAGRVRAGGTEMGDRIGVRRKGLRVRRAEDMGGRGGGGEEGLEERMARLRREVEECRVLAEKEGEEGEEVEGEVEELGRVLGRLDGGGWGRKGRRRGETMDGKGGGQDEDEDREEDRVLGRVAGFDTRLAALEQALGISSLDAVSSQATSTPILPSLTLLDQQLHALSTAASITQLEANHTKLQSLKPSSTEAEAPTLSEEETAKIQSLYSLLPTLQSLSPTLPALLSRLKSLRHLHAQAGSAESLLEEVESRQAEVDKELAQWREGLERVETAVEEASEANGKNGAVVERWVKGIEERVRGLE